MKQDLKSYAGVWITAGIIAAIAIVAFSYWTMNHRAAEEERLERQRAYIEQQERENRKIEAQGSIERKKRDEEMKRAKDQGAREGDETFKAREEKLRRKIALDE